MNIEIHLVAKEPDTLQFQLDGSVGDLINCFTEIYDIPQGKKFVHKVLEASHTAYMNKENKVWNSELEENYTIDAFYKSLVGLKTFIKGMRINGFLGKSPQNPEDLDMQVAILQQLQETKFFVEDLVSKFKLS